MVSGLGLSYQSYFYFLLGEQGRKGGIVCCCGGFNERATFFQVDTLQLSHPIKMKTSVPREHIKNYYTCTSTMV